MKVVVFGAGSLGSLVGGLLAGEHEVTLVGRDPHVTRVREDGLTLSGELDRHVRPDAGLVPPERADLAVVTVKSYDTAGAARALADCELGACLSLQNGMGNEETLTARVDCPVLAGTCTYGARLTDPGEVACTGVGEVALGPADGGSSTVADRVGEGFAAAGIETVVAEDMPRRRWEKLAVNAGINAATALARVPNGALLDGPAGGVARDAAREAARVARERGVDLGEDAAVALVESVAGDTAANRSSMLQDLDRGARTEVEAINGVVVDRADGPVPVNESLRDLLRAWEREHVPDREGTATTDL